MCGIPINPGITHSILPSIKCNNPSCINEFCRPSTCQACGTIFPSREPAFCGCVLCQNCYLISVAQDSRCINCRRSMTNQEIVSVGTV